MIIIILGLISITLVVSMTIFQSIDEIKALEKKTIFKILNIIVTTFFQQTWNVIVLLLFILFFYILYQFNQNSN